MTPQRSFYCRRVQLQWCGHCKSLAPDWATLGTTFKSSQSSIVIGKVDADAHRDLGSKFGVSGFPTIKYFPANSQSPEDYSGGRSADDLVEFINGKTGLKKKVRTAHYVLMKCRRPVGMWCCGHGGQPSIARVCHVRLVLTLTSHPQPSSLCALCHRHRRCLTNNACTVCQSPQKQPCATTRR